MAARLEGRIALITGGASGIGLGIAQRFAEEGATIVLADIAEPAAMQALKSLQGETHVALPLDVTDDGAWLRCLNQVAQQFGHLDILVNNAGLPAHGSIEDTTPAEWNRITSVNADGVFLGCRHAIRVMKHRGGCIVNIVSIAALQATMLGPSYGASKAAAWNLTKSVALHCAKSGYPIRCNAVLPGLTRTAMTERAPRETIEKLRLAVPMKRMADPRDIANAALFLASDEAAYITGADLIVDGGLSL